jgi:hypothetical protein
MGIPKIRFEENPVRDARAKQGSERDELGDEVALWIGTQGIERSTLDDAPSLDDTDLGIEFFHVAGVVGDDQGGLVQRTKASREKAANRTSRSDIEGRKWFVQKQQFGLN